MYYECMFYCVCVCFYVYDIYPLVDPTSIHQNERKNKLKLSQEI